MAGGVGMGTTLHEIEVQTHLKPGGIKEGHWGLGSVVGVVVRTGTGTNSQANDVQTHLKPTGMIGGQEGLEGVVDVDAVGMGINSQ